MSETDLIVYKLRGLVIRLRSRSTQKIKSWFNIITVFGSDILSWRIPANDDIEWRTRETLVHVSTWSPSRRQYNLGSLLFTMNICSHTTERKVKNTAEYGAYRKNRISTTLIIPITLISTRRHSYVWNILSSIRLPMSIYSSASSHLHKIRK